MSEKTKNILKKVSGWVVFVIIIFFLVCSPNFYLLAHGGGWNGRSAVCGTASPNATATTLQDISLHSDYWNFQQVSVSGNLSYNSMEETFYLHDGAFIIPVDVSDCQNLFGFKNDTGFLVGTTGSLAKNGDKLVLILTSLKESVPPFIQLLYNTSLWGIFALVIVIFMLPYLFILWVLRRIGILKPKPAQSPDVKKENFAHTLLMAGIFAPILWLFNPIVGAVYHIIAVIFFRKGLDSKKRKTALAGMILCIGGFAVMLFVSVGRGSFERPAADFFNSTFNNEAAKPTGQERLELKPYFSKSFFFSIHQPKGWTVDEKITTDSMLAFNGPEDGSVNGKPFHPQIKFVLLPVQAVKVNTLDDVAKLLESSLAKQYKKFTLKIEKHTLAGGRLDTLYPYAVYTKDGIEIHELGMVAIKNTGVYLLKSTIPSEKWDRYESLLRESFGTVEILTDNLATCLKIQGVALYGAYNTDATKQQINFFNNNTDGLPYVECDTFDGKTELKICSDKNITVSPVWEFADGSRLNGSQYLKTLSAKANCRLSQ